MSVGFLGLSGHKFVDSPPGSRGERYSEPPRAWRVGTPGPPGEAPAGAAGLPAAAFCSRHRSLTDAKPAPISNVSTGRTWFHRSAVQKSDANTAAPLTVPRSPCGPSRKLALLDRLYGRLRKDPGSSSTVVTQDVVRQEGSLMRQQGVVARLSLCHRRRARSWWAVIRATEASDGRTYRSNDRRERCRLLALSRATSTPASA